MAQFSGIITWIGEVRSGETNGNQWQSQDFEVTELAQSQYPQKVVVSMKGDRLSQFKAMLIPNASVTIDFDYVVRLWEGKRFMNLRCWNVKPFAAQQPQYQPQPQFQQPTQQYQAQPQPQYQPQVQAQPQAMPQQAPVQQQPQYQAQAQPQQMPQTEYPFPPPSSY